MASTKEEERWQAKRSTIMERNKYMFNNPLMSDIKFAFPNTDTTIPAHKYVLAVSSPVFFAMFYGDLAETRDTIDITDCDPDIFRLFLRFLYCDEAGTLETQTAIKVWHLAYKYDVPSLARERVKHLDGDMHLWSTFDILTYARQFNDRILEAACWEVIDYNAEEIVAYNSHLNIKHELLVFFVSRSLRIQEATLFKAVDCWAAKRCEEARMTVDGANKRDALGEDLLKHFRFPLMSPTQFSEVVLPKEILTRDEVIDVFKSFSKVPIHGGLKFSDRPRVTSTDTAVLLCPPLGNGVLTKGPGYEAGKLTFAASKNVLLCGLGYLFSDGDSRRRLRLSVSRTGEKIKELSATHRNYYYDCSSFPSSPLREATNVFFNRPIYVQAKTCHTIELIEVSSRSQNVFVTNKYEFRPPTCQNGDLTFRYCRGCHSDREQYRSYSGFITTLLFTTSTS